eukprot:gene17798-23406_t
MSNESAIKKQVEFYFSDSNFRKDTFLKAAADSDPEGFVPISVLLTFNKLRNLTTDEAAVANAIANSNVITLDEDRTRVRRLNPLPEDDTSKPKTLYVKGFPVEEPIVTIDEITEIFSVYGDIAIVRLRRDETKKFKGSCFIEFVDKEGMLAAIAAANVEGKEGVQISYKGTPFLCVLSLENWLGNRAAKRSRKKQERRTVDDNNNSSTSVGDKRKREETDYTSGLIVKLSDIPSDSSLFQLKEALKEVANVKFVDFKPGDNFAFVRLASTEDTDKLLKAAETDLSIGKVTGILLVDDEEVEYWKKITDNSKAKGKRGGKGGRVGGRGGRGRGNKRGRY